MLKTVPGVAIGQQGGRGTLTSLFLRGAESRHTAVVIDGVKSIRLILEISILVAYRLAISNVSKCCVASNPPFGEAVLWVV